MSTAAGAISIDRFRRRRDRADAQAPQAPAAHPLVGTVLGTLDRRYGLMSSEESVAIAHVIATSGDLAVADRLAFIAALEQRMAFVVVEVEGSYLACSTDRALDAAQVAHLRCDEGAPRIMSIVSDRGITPALGPLCA